MRILIGAGGVYCLASARLRGAFRGLVLVAVVVPGLHAQTITPRFAWPANTVAEIQGAGYSVMQANGSIDSSSYTSLGRLEVRPHADGLLIISGPTSGGPKIATTSANGISLDAMQRAISRYVVSRAGQFVRLDDSVAQTRSMDSLLSPLFDRVAAMNPSMAASMKAELSGSARNGAASGWKALSAFAARTWAPGDSTIDTVRQAIPGLQGAEMIVTTVLRYAGTTPCPTYVTVRTCWRFTTRSGSDMSSMRASLAAMLAKSGIDDASILDRMPIPVTSSDGYMVVDAETSRPLELGTKSNTVSSGTIGETPFSASARIRMVSEYHWRPL